MDELADARTQQLADLRAEDAAPAFDGLPAGSLRIAAPVDDAQRTALHRFRYEVYVDEMRRPQVHADHVRRCIVDPLDATAHDLVAWLDGRIVGCVRMNLAADGGLGEYEAFYEMPRERALHPAHTAIVTRLMVAPAQRRTPLPARLCSAVYSLALPLGVRVAYIDCNAHLHKFFRHLGFVAHVGEREHPEYGRVQPMRLDLLDAGHLRRVRSPLLQPLMRFVAQRDGGRAAKRTEPTPAASREDTMPIHEDPQASAHAVIAAAFARAMDEFEAAPAIQALLSGRLTPAHYAVILREIHHYAKEDPQIQALAAVYFRGADREMVQGFLRHATSEIGHDRMALDDMRALGVPVDDVVLRNPLPRTMALTAFPFYQIMFRNPVGYLGYLYFLEHMPTRAGARYAAALVAAGVPTTALSFLSEHTTVDVAHNRLMSRYIDALVHDAADVAAITYAIRTTAVLYADMLQGAILDAELPQDAGLDHGELARSPGTGGMRESALHAIGHAVLE